jgi:CDGSH-type Zn-finger protein
MEPLEGAKIKVTVNGPYLVSGATPLTRQTIVVDDDGESVSWSESEREHEHPHYALCRCGASHGKPFCDGSHLSSGFDGTETAVRLPYDELADDIVGPELILRDEVVLCADARFCHRAGGAWNLVKSDDDGNAATVRAEAELCPSGRYTAIDRATGEHFEPDLPPSVGIVEDPHERVAGPLWVRGGVPVESADGHVYETRNRVTLCRCGGSSNKPFCDGTHLEIGFRDDE